MTPMTTTSSNRTRSANRPICEALRLAMSDTDGRSSDQLGGLLNTAFLPGVSEELEPFLEEMIGGSFSVLHEIASDHIHLDVLAFPPTRTSPCWTFVTSGMSSKPMQDGGEAAPKAWQYAELVLRLPRNWFSVRSDMLVPDEELMDESKYWPIGVLKFVARAPHKYGFWVGPDHSFPNGDPADAYHSSVPFTGVVLNDVEGWPRMVTSLTTKDRTKINFLALMFVYPEEMEYKLGAGARSLGILLRRAGVGQVLDTGRRSVIEAT